MEHLTINNLRMFNYWLNINYLIINLLQSGT